MAFVLKNLLICLILFSSINSETLQKMKIFVFIHLCQIMNLAVMLNII